MLAEQKSKQTEPQTDIITHLITQPNQNKDLSETKSTNGFELFENVFRL